jgi:hypothetical protein
MGFEPQFLGFTAQTESNHHGHHAIPQA